MTLQTPQPHLKAVQKNKVGTLQKLKNTVGNFCATLIQDPRSANYEKIKIENQRFLMQLENIIDALFHENDLTQNNATISGTQTPKNIERQKQLQDMWNKIHDHIQVLDRGPNRDKDDIYEMIKFLRVLKIFIKQERDIYILINGDNTLGKAQKFLRDIEDRRIEYNNNALYKHQDITIYTKLLEYYINKVRKYYDLSSHGEDGSNIVPIKHTG